MSHHFGGSMTPGCNAELAALVLSGDLYAGRRVAVQASFSRLQADVNLFWPVDSGNAAPAFQLNKEAAAHCAHVWQDAVESLVRNPRHLELVAEMHGRHGKDTYTDCKAPCLLAKHAHNIWEECCSSLPRSPSACTRLHANQTSCCVMSAGSKAFLSLPVLREISIQVGLQNGRLLRIEQDGLLRPFDVSTVLWPAGYLLSQWVSSPEQCAPREGRRRVLEVGAGTCTAGIAAATCGYEVVCTDVASWSLPLATANAHMNNVGGLVRVARFDWDDDDGLKRVAAMGPFDLIIGAALQFEKWLPRMWYVLEVLTDKSDTCTADTGTGALVALSHTTGSLPEPPAPFAITERVSGLDFGMHTAWSEVESDFEVLCLLRTR
mmetsp:Transcript_11870/g.25686  ORF Transcript_11870/g.25686 Transcript_11870/m.25686 type:complete len:378 (-) Transcript_11870:379-1512(-)